jgi:hypothetical protein
LLRRAESLAGKLPAVPAGNPAGLQPESLLLLSRCCRLHLLMFLLHFLCWLY